MGGQRETFASAEVAKGNFVTIGNIRFHESGGKIHFHVDDQNLKVAVPSSQWFAAWEKLSREPGRWVYVDPEFEAMLLVETIFDYSTGFSAKLTISQVKLNAEFKALHKFTMG